MTELEKHQSKQKIINRNQLIENINHEAEWMRLSVPGSNFVHIMIEFDRDWMDENYPQIVYEYLGSHYLKHIPQEIDDTDNW